MSKPQPVTLEELQAIPVLESLPPVQLRMLGSLMQRVSVKNGQVLLTLGEPGQRVFFLQSGTVRTCIERPARRQSSPNAPIPHHEPEQESSSATTQDQVSEAQASDEQSTQAPQEESPHIVLNLCGQGEMLGEISSLDGQGCLSGVVAVEPCRALWMEGDDFRDCVQQMPALALAVLRDTQRRFRNSTRQLYAFSTMDVMGRLASQLLLLAERYGQQTPEGGLFIPLRLQQTDLADMIGSTRPRISLGLTAMRANGCLSLEHRGFITIHDRERLAAHLGRSL